MKNKISVCFAKARFFDNKKKPMRPSHKPLFHGSCAVFSAFFSLTAIVQSDFWEQTNGPYGGGVSRSTANGDSWNSINTGLTNSLVLALDSGIPNNGTKGNQTQVFSDSVQAEWIRYYGSGQRPDFNVATAMEVDGLGNVYVTGRSGDAYSNYDYATVKYNSMGAEQWVVRYDGPGNWSDEATAIAVDGAGNVYVTGKSYGSNTYEDYATVKYNSAGMEQWVARYNGPRNSADAAIALAVDSEGNVYVTGSTVDPSGLSEDYATVKYDSTGTAQWVAHYDGPGRFRDVATAIAIDGAGNAYITGESHSTSGKRDYATIKYDPFGLEQWVARYDGPGNADDGAFSLAVDRRGNVYVTGWSYGSDTGYDYATIKYDSTGMEQWVARYDTSDSYDVATDLGIDGSGNVYVTGYSLDSGPGHDYATVKYDTDGMVQWTARHDASDVFGQSKIALAVDGSGNVYVTGWGYRSDTYLDYVTVKYNSAGTEQWVARYNGSGNSWDLPTGIAVDDAGNVYVAGTSQPRDRSWSIYATIKYTQTLVSVKEKAPGTPNNYWLSQNYPNPFNASTEIRFTLPKPGYATLKVFDLLGKEVATLVNETKPAGEHRVHWNPVDLSSGVYVYRLQVGGFVQAKRLLLLK